jgi:hypothetical protein
MFSKRCSCPAKNRELFAILRVEAVQKTSVLKSIFPTQSPVFTVFSSMLVFILHVTEIYLLSTEIFSNLLPFLLFRIHYLYPTPETTKIEITVKFKNKTKNVLFLPEMS